MTNKSVKFSVSVGAVIVIAVAYMLGAVRFLLLIAAATIAHELGHYLAVRAFGRAIISVRLNATGITIRRPPPESYIEEIVIAAAGPMASVILAAAMAVAARIYGVEIARTLAGTSIVFAMFNILPVLPLDGGRILYAVLARMFGLYAAERVTCISSCAVIFLLLCAGGYVFVVTRTNFTLLTAAVWMLIYYCKTGNDGIKSML